MTDTPITAYPLSWPPHVPRSRQRKSGQFKVSFSDARADLADALATLQRDLNSVDGTPLRAWIIVNPNPAKKVFKPLSWDRAMDTAWAKAQTLMAMASLPEPR